MTAYRDSADWVRSGIPTGHLVAESLEELHAVAGQLGLASVYFQGQMLTPHYHLPASLHAAADRLGVVYLERARFTQMVGRINDLLYAASHPRARPEWTKQNRKGRQHKKPVGRLQPPSQPPLF